MATRGLMPWASRRRLAPFAWGENDPFRSLHREVDRLFEDFMRGLDIPPFRTGDGLMVPDVDVAETDKEIQVSVELPGVDEKDIEVSLSDGVLTIRGEKRVEKEEKDKEYHRLERSYGAFERALTMPVAIDEDKVDATFAKGVLTITVQKKPGAKAAKHKIKVKAHRS
ncbi:MAG: Hsp20/alpha crystallin family protein [Alphaproteobacteria bacterium]